MQYDNRQTIGRCYGCQCDILEDEPYGFITDNRGRHTVHDDPDCIREAAGFTPAEIEQQNRKPLSQQAVDDCERAVKYAHGFNDLLMDVFPELKKII